ncbi:MAG: ACP S-malonyltransferase [Rhodoluna sp.]
MIVAASIATANLLNLASVKVVAGHSVGEVAAGFAAGALDSSSAMKLVDFRGKAMMKAAKAGQETSMAAVLGGMEDEVLAKLDNLGLTPANYNGAGQIVAAGLKSKIAELVADPPQGAKVIALSVAGAFHTKFMASAVEALSEFAKTITVNDPTKTLLSNQQGQIISSGADYIERLVGQVANPVRWDLCMKKMNELGVTGLIELAPGGTLVGLAKRGMTETECVALKTPDDLDKAIELIGVGN